MKRVDEKVKDIVEVRQFSSLRDFAVDPARTLNGYHFTDITSDLMAKWLDAVTNVKSGQGSTHALAGFRGVGKSHFLAVLATIVSRPDLRPAITDQHIAARAEMLSRRPNAIAFVRRGSKDTLLEELKDGLAEILDTEPHQLSNSFNDLLLKASELAGEMPLVLLIDTALTRDVRVARDDGAVLSQIAETVKSLGIFVGLALDDDIAGADGANASISANFGIDYLDQEHLYKVVDSHIFAKKEKALPILHGIYKYFSQVLPGFRWSEQRFTSLYPLHPATLEIAPLIRLYLQDFAMLGFASEAGARILGRPANSLVGLDEIFDAVEKKLRDVPDLAEAFVGFDQLDREVVSKTPVQLRLPAKLILKGLFMLSLDGQGSTATNVAASMLVFNDSESGASSIDVSELLEMLSTAMPEVIAKSERDGAEPKYCFKFASKDGQNELLDAAAKGVSIQDVRSLLLRHAGEKFSDFGALGEAAATSTNCSLEWRGAIRHGEISWSVSDDDNPSEPASPSMNHFDWKVLVSFEGSGSPALDETATYPLIQWRVADLRNDELDAIRRFFVLQTDANVRGQFGERLAAASNIQALTVERIWKRIFLSDGVLTYGSKDFRFGDEARGAHTLSHLFTVMLRPIFETEYSEHPEFEGLLGVKEAAKLTDQFFGGAARMNTDVQKLAETFCLPLGLVEIHDDGFIPASAETLAEVPVLRAAFTGLKISDDSVVTIDELSKRMLAAPYGLTREARHLVLTALVAQRQYEFVTFSGNRINHRSLDLQIIWDDIAGLAHPFTEVYSSSRLREWAVLVTGKTTIKSLDRSEDRLVIIEALSEWLSEWKVAKVLEGIETLPDENLNSSIWRIAANLRKTFGAVAECIESLVQNVMPLDQCIHTIADLFSDSNLEFERKKKDLDVLQDFTHGVAKRNEIIKYLALCETTVDRDIEERRRRLIDVTGSDNFDYTTAARSEIEVLWTEFKGKYSQHYIENHDSVMNSAVVEEKLEAILKSKKWAAFENFSDLVWFDPHFASGARSVIRDIPKLKCKSNVAELLKTQPFCSCSFSLARFERRRNQPNRLEIIVNQGLTYFRMRLIENGKELAETIEAISGGNDDTVKSLKKWLVESKDSDSFGALSTSEIHLLRTGVERANNQISDLGKAKLPPFDDLFDLLPYEVRDWENEIDRLEIFVENKT